MPRTSNSKSSVPMAKPHSTSLVPSPSLPAQSSFGQVIKEGLAWGTGQALAHRAVAAVLGPSVPVQTKIESPCEKERIAFETCMKTKSTEDFCGEEQMLYTRCLHPQG
jgi:hypothetical protein